MQYAHVWELETIVYALLSNSDDAQYIPTIDDLAILLLTQMQLNFGSFFRWSCVLWFLGFILEINM